MPGLSALSASIRFGVPMLYLFPLSAFIVFAVSIPGLSLLFASSRPVPCLFALFASIGSGVPVPGWCALSTFAGSILAVSVFAGSVVLVPCLSAL